MENAAADYARKILAEGRPEWMDDATYTDHVAFYQSLIADNGAADARAERRREARQ